MTRLRLARLSVLPMMLAIAACKGKQSSADDGASAGSVVGAAPQSAGGEVTAREIAMYPLDMEKMRRWANATKAMGVAFEKNPAAAAAMGRPAENETPSQQIARMEGSPLTMTVLRENGLSARDYVMILGSYLQASMVGAAMSANPAAKLPDGQSPENVKFVQANKAELERLFKDLREGDE